MEPINAVDGRPIDAKRRAATEARLTSLLDWYTKHARREAWCYRGLKVVAITAAAAVSVLATTGVPTLAIASLGALVVVVEGIQQLFQFHTNSISYATTKEVLKREKALYDAGAGAYASVEGAADADRVLAERIEAAASKELDAWAASHRKTEER